MEKFFTLLESDLRALVQWDAEERDKIHDKKTIGYLWLHRGLLALRLGRTHLAERSFRNVVEQGFSVRASSELLKLYHIPMSIKSIVLTIAEVIEVMD